MKKTVCAITLSLVACLGHTASETTERLDKTLILPEGVITTPHPVKKQFAEQSRAGLAEYRPNDNMPEIVNEDFLRTYTDKDNIPKTTQFLGYLPKLKVLPCEKDCTGPDYEAAVAAFKKGYKGDGGFFKERGEFIVQVRWYNRRSFIQRSLPYGADVFGVSFLYEGKLVSIGTRTLVGSKETVNNIAETMGARLATELAFTLGMGAKAPYLTPLNDDALGGAVGALRKTGRVFSATLGVEDVQSRIEPASTENNNLLPAIDGILPGELHPIDEMMLIKSLHF